MQNSFLVGKGVEAAMGDLTFGAVGAALIAAVMSLIGLVLAKEQKTSEFRQDWINSLRNEIADYVTNVSSISDQLKIKFKDNSEKVKSLIPHYIELNKVSNLIKLRLNPGESRAANILRIMDEIENKSHSDADMSDDSIQKLENSLISESQALLKEEWKRVKEGEMSFKIAKRTAFGVIALIVIALIYHGFQDRMHGGVVKKTTNEMHHQDKKLIEPAPKPSAAPRLVAPMPTPSENKPANQS